MTADLIPANRVPVTEAQAELAELKARNCETCKAGHVNCPHTIVYTDGGSMDIDYCSEWVAQETTP